MSTSNCFVRASRTSFALAWSSIGALLLSFAAAGCAAPVDTAADGDGEENVGAAEEAFTFLNQTDTLPTNGSHASFVAPGASPWWTSMDLLNHDIFGANQYMNIQTHATWPSLANNQVYTAAADAACRAAFTDVYLQKPSAGGWTVVESHRVFASPQLGISGGLVVITDCKADWGPYTECSPLLWGQSEMLLTTKTGGTSATGFKSDRVSNDNWASCP